MRFTVNNIDARKIMHSFYFSSIHDCRKINKGDEH